LMATATLLQKYTKVSDNEVFALLFADRRWQMVLDCLNSDEPPFGQSTFFDFRMRMIASGMDQRILERTAEIARETGGFTSRGLKMALDSAPLEGHGKVEDTVNLLAHAARKAITCIAHLTNYTVEQMARQMDAELFTGSSIKAALDVNWSEPEEKKEALERLYCEIEHLELWLRDHFPQECKEGALQESLEQIDRLLIQNLEPDPEGGLVRMLEGVATNRQISISDPEMRHGRKSKSKRFDGLKNHIARDLEEKLILAACTTAANVPDAQVAEELIKASVGTERELESLSVDRAYLQSQEVIKFAKEGGELLCRPPASSNSSGLFSKREFEIELEQMKATCPGGQSIEIELGKIAEFSADECDVCPLREQCTTRKLGRGRTLKIHENEELYQQLRVIENTSEGRAKLRKRTGVEHGLSHIVQRQGKKARYNGTRKNTFELRMVAAIQNLQRAQALETEKLQKAS
jgi:hypothetical protein